MPILPLYNAEQEFFFGRGTHDHVRFRAPEHVCVCPPIAGFPCGFPKPGNRGSARAPYNGIFESKEQVSAVEEKHKNVIFFVIAPRRAFSTLTTGLCANKNAKFY